MTAQPPLSRLVHRPPPFNPAPGSIVALVLEYVRAHPWCRLRDIRRAVDRSNPSGALTRLLDVGQIERRGMDDGAQVDTWRYAMNGTPWNEDIAAAELGPARLSPSAPSVVPIVPVVRERSSSPFTDLDRALDLIARFERTVADQDVEIGVLRAERDEARQTLSLLQRSMLVGVVVLVLMVASAQAQTPSAWNSWDVVTQAGSPQGIVVAAATGTEAVLEFYESTNNGGVAKGDLLPVFFAPAHPFPDNRVGQYWAPATGGPVGPGDVYPYAGKSLIGRGSDVGESGAPAPLGVRDLQLQPPNNAHLMVVAFRVPADGTYTISGLGVRHIDANNGPSVVRVFDAQARELTMLQATNSRAWVTSPTTYTLPNLTAGQYIYFAADSMAGANYPRDFTEVAWTITSGPALPPNQDPTSTTPLPYPLPTGYALELRQNGNVVMSWTTTIAADWLCDQPTRTPDAVVKNPQVVELRDFAHEGRTCRYRLRERFLSLPSGSGYVLSAQALGPFEPGPFEDATPAFSLEASIVAYVLQIQRNGQPISETPSPLSAWTCGRVPEPAPVGPMVNPARVQIRDPAAPSDLTCVANFEALFRSLPAGANYSAVVVPMLSSAPPNDRGVAIPTIPEFAIVPPSVPRPPVNAIVLP